MLAFLVKMHLQSLRGLAREAEVHIYLLVVNPLLLVSCSTRLLFLQARPPSLTQKVEDFHGSRATRNAQVEAR